MGTRGSSRRCLFFLTTVLCVLVQASGVADAPPEPVSSTMISAPERTTRRRGGRPSVLYVIRSDDPPRELSVSEDSSDEEAKLGFHDAESGGAIPLEEFYAAKERCTAVLPGLEADIERVRQIQRLPGIPCDQPTMCALDKALTWGCC